MAKRRTNGKREQQVRNAHTTYEAECANYTDLLRKHADHTHFPRLEIQAVFNGLQVAAFEGHKAAEAMRAAVARLADVYERGNDSATLAALGRELEALELIEDAD